MSDREHLMELGDQVIAAWQRTEQSGKVSVTLYENVPQAPTGEDGEEGVTAENIQTVIQMFFELMKAEQNAVAQLDKEIGKEVDQEDDEPWDTKEGYE